jgi:hypothetical protein
MLRLAFGSAGLVYRIELVKCSERAGYGRRQANSGRAERYDDDVTISNAGGHC